MSDSTERSRVDIRPADASALAPVMEIMREAFDPCFGEAWNAAQCSAILGSTGVWLLCANYEDRPAGFALTRAIAGEAELLLIAVHPRARGKGIGRALLDAVAQECRRQSVAKLFLEVRANNSAIKLYSSYGFRKMGERRDYYRGADGKSFDAHSYSLEIG